MNNIILLVRALIGDQEYSRYSDEVLYRLIVVSSLMISNEMHFDTKYDINISNATINPEPDNTFSLFTAYKTAILLIQAELMKYGGKNIKITDGPSSIDLTGVVTSLKSNLQSYIEQFNKFKQEYNMNGALGYAIITPTTVEYMPTGDFS
jgi:hypothetical protein